VKNDLRQETPLQIRLVTVVGSSDDADDLERLVGDAPIRIQRVEPGPAAPFRSAYQRSSLGVIAIASAMPAAAAVQRLRLVPWVARLGPEALSGPRPRALRQAAAVLVSPRAADAARELAPHARVIGADDRVATALLDIALAPEARGMTRSRLRPALADLLPFLDARAAALAMRLVAITGAAPRPIHPKHLVSAESDAWYLDELDATDRVLDLGCANGAHTLAAARTVRDAVGADVDERHLEAARAAAAEAGLENVRFVGGDLTDQAFLASLDGRFDAVLAFAILEHIVDRNALLRAVSSLLVPGGKLLVTVPNLDTPYKQWRRRGGGFAYSDPDHKTEYTAESIREELERAGFSLERITPAGYETPFGGFGALVAPVSLAVYGRMAARRRRLLLEHPERAGSLAVVARRASD
jgi:SAM-dependent methyltransferase